MFRALLPLAGFVLLLLMVAGGVSAAAGTPARERPARPARPARPDKRPLTLSEWEIIVLILGALIAIPAAIWIGGEAGVGASLVPAVLWFLVLGAVLGSAGTRREHAASAERAAAEAASADARQRAGARKAAARRAIADYGAAGVALLNRADAAVKKISESEAMRSGWFGCPDDLDLQAERAAIADDLRKAMAIRDLTAKSQALGAREFVATDAERTSDRLRESAGDRVCALENCADELEHIAVQLAEQRRQARVAERQDELESQLAALLYTVEAAGDAERPRPVEAIEARAAAVREVVGMAPREAAPRIPHEVGAAPQAAMPGQPEEPRGQANPGGFLGAVFRLFTD